MRIFLFLPERMKLSIMQNKVQSIGPRYNLMAAALMVQQYVFLFALRYFSVTSGTLPVEIFLGQVRYGFSINLIQFSLCCKRRIQFVLSGVEPLSVFQNQKIFGIAPRRIQLTLSATRWRPTTSREKKGKEREKKVSL